MMKAIRVLLISQIGVLLIALIPAPASAFSLSGQYEGVVACDSTTAGTPGSWGRNIRVAIVHEKAELRVEYKYTDKAELGREYTLYNGKAAVSPDSTIVSAYFYACDASFPALELVQMFPSSTASDPFVFAADSIWVSDQVPNLPGLTVQSCRWSLQRVSTETPEVRSCPIQ